MPRFPTWPLNGGECHLPQRGATERSAIQAGGGESQSSIGENQGTSGRRTDTPHGQRDRGIPSSEGCSLQGEMSATTGGETGLLTFRHVCALASPRSLRPFLGGLATPDSLSEPRRPRRPSRLPGSQPRPRDPQDPLGSQGSRGAGLTSAAGHPSRWLKAAPPGSSGEREVPAGSPRPARGFRAGLGLSLQPRSSFFPASELERPACNFFCNF